MKCTACALIASFLLTSCSPKEPPATPGGVPIVKTAARASMGFTMELAKTPSLDLGGSSGSEQFSPRAGYLYGIVLSNGGSAAIDASRIHFYDATGKQTGIIGQSGSGPADFRDLQSICATTGDTLVAEDGPNARIAIVDAMKRVVIRTISDSLGQAWPQACFDDGTFFVAKMTFDQTTKNASYHVRRLHLDGTIATDFGVIPGPASDAVGIAQLYAVAAGKTLFVGNPTWSEIKSYDVGAKATRVLHANDPIIEVSAKEADARTGAAVSTSSSPDVLSRERDRLNALSGTRHLPFFDRLFVDPDGRVWLENHFDGSSNADTWTGFDAEGKLLGQLRITGEVVGFTKGGVMINQLDSEGDRHLRIFAIQKK